MKAHRMVLAAMLMAGALLTPVRLRAAQILTKSKQKFTGQIVEETPENITIATASGKVTIPLTEVRMVIRDTVAKKPKIVPKKIEPAKAQEAFEGAKTAITQQEWAKAGGLLAGLLQLPATVFPQEKRLAATAALVTCHLQIKDAKGAAAVFRQRAGLVLSESDKKRLLATADALDEAETPTGLDVTWQFVQTYDDAIAAGMKWKTEGLLEDARKIGEEATNLNTWTWMQRAADAALAKLAEGDLYTPGFSGQHREEALSYLADNAIKGAETAVETCTTERKLTITPYYLTSAASVNSGRVYNEYAARYLARRQAAEDALDNIERLAKDYNVPEIYGKRKEKIDGLKKSLEELRYHLMVPGMPRQLLIAPRRIGSQF